MKLIRFLAIIFVLIIAVISGAWYYVMHQVSNEINNKYAGQKFSVKGMKEKEYVISFDKITPSGFPFKIALNIQGWKEESRVASITYPAPIKLGYDLLSQQLFVDYDGEIIASYKPEKRGFGSKLKINDYSIKVDLPLTIPLVKTLKNIDNPVGIINYLGEVNIATGRVEIFDLVSDEKFYDKEYEHFKLSFIPQKEYKSLEDLITNIPQHYTVDYTVNLHAIDAEPRILPVSLFYGFSILPSGLNMEASAIVKTAGNNINEITKNLDIQAKISCDSPFVKLQKLIVDYKTGGNLINNSYAINANSKINVKEGMFDKLFDKYRNLAPRLKTTSIGSFVDREVEYIIRNKNNFRFKDIENTDYDFNLIMNSSASKHNSRAIKIDDLNIESKDSGIRLQHEMEYSVARDKKILANGLLYIKNYPTVVDFISGYIYRFGKFKVLSEEARKLYVDVNTEFLKSISDHPDSTSKDLSFKYKVDSRRLRKAEFGSTSIDKIVQSYSLTLYKKLFDKVGYGGDVLARMQKIIPTIDAKDPFLQQVLPKISGDKLNKSLKKEIDKVVPPEAKNIIGKLMPKGGLGGKDFLKNLTK